MSSIFTKILNKEIPCFKIAETENCFAFLDINPNTVGHTLCVPKKEEDYIFDLDTDTYNDLLNFSKTIALAIKKAIPCSKVAMTVIGLEVPHAHIHLIPTNEMNDVGFKHKKKCSDEEFEKIASKIKSFL